MLFSLPGNKLPLSFSYIAPRAGAAETGCSEQRRARKTAVNNLQSPGTQIRQWKTISKGLRRKEKMK